MSITDTTSSLGSAITDTVSDLVHDVSTLAPELVRAVADAGQHGLVAVGLIDPPRHRRRYPILGLILVGLLTFGIIKVLRARKTSPPAPVGTTGHSPTPLSDAVA